MTIWLWLLRRLKYNALCFKVAAAESELRRGLEDALIISTEAAWHKSAEIRLTMQSLAKMLSRASSAEDDFAYLTKTIPLAAIRSILQYSKSLNFDISSCTASTQQSFTQAPKPTAGFEEADIQKNCGACL